MKIVNPKNGESFDSQFNSHVLARVKLLERITAGEFADPKFPQSIYEATCIKVVNTRQVQQGSAGQLFWLQKLATEGSKRAASPASKTNLSAIKEMLVTAKANGLKWPKLTLTTKHGLELKVSLAGDESRNPGCVYIAAGGKGGAYYGKVTPSGDFFHGKDYQPDIGVLLTEMARSPKEAARAQGALTGRCCFCNKGLTKEESTTLGYGPTCARKFGLTHSKKAAQSKIKNSGLRPERDLLGEEIKPKVRVLRRVRRKVEEA